MIPASGVRRSWLTAASRAVRMLLAAASRSASAACAASRCLLQRDGGLLGEGHQHPPVAGGQGPPGQPQREGVGDRDGLDRPSSPAGSAAGADRRSRRRRCARPSSPSCSPKASRICSSRLGSAAVPGEHGPGQRGEHRRLGLGAGGCGGPAGGAVHDGGHGDGHDQPAQQRHDVVDLVHGQPPGGRRRRTSSPPAHRAPRPRAPATGRRPGRRRAPAAGTPGARSTARPPSGGQAERGHARARRPRRAARPSHRRRAVSAPVSGGSRQPRDPAAAWVTMCTSISPESAMTWPIRCPARTARDQRERRLVPSTSCVASTLRANSSRAAGHVVADDLVVGAAEALHQLPLGAQRGRARRR